MVLVRGKDIYYQVYESSANFSNSESSANSFADKTKNLVLLHGFMGSTLDWNPLVNFLLAQLSGPLKIISILLPGHTQEVSNSLKNNISTGDFSKIQNLVNSSNNSLSKLAQQVLEIQKKEEALDCHYLGYSMGGRLATELANLNPRTETLILESSFTHWENKEAQNLKKKEDCFLLKPLLSLTDNFKKEEKIGSESKDDLLHKNFKSFLLNWYNLNLFKGLDQNKNFSLLLKTRMQQNVKHLHEALQAYSSSTVNSYLDVLKKLHCPVFYIYGDTDTKYKAIGLNLKKIISSVNLQEIKNASHNTHFQQALHFNQTLLNILKLNS
ncbi:MAG: alpha/beta fold hydrolase [Bdellovibrionaceae bacterium]|nr:alpha/beta fold hydrolase [Pseudobdellovibrionaceae bacterium]